MPIQKESRRTKTIILKKIRLILVLPRILNIKKSLSKLLEDNKTYGLYIQVVASSFLLLYIF